MEGSTSAHSTLAIEATGLEKSFGDTKAVCGVDLAVRRGSVYGMLGPNGAGKTTTIRMLATLLRPDGGEARVLGHDVVREADAVRRSVSLTGQLASVDEDLTGRENLILIARLLGYGRADARTRADDLLEAFGLADASGRLVKNYSGGMRRRLDIAASLVVTPELMFLDEPTTGLDPRSRNQVWAIIRALAGAGTTVLLCTQYLDEADQLADGIAVIDQGKVIAEGTPRSSRRRSAPGRSESGCSIPSSGRSPSRSSPVPSPARCTSKRTQQRCRRRAPTPTRRPRLSASSRARASRSRTSPSASPAWTRSSWR